MKPTLTLALQVVEISYNPEEHEVQKVGEPRQVRQLELILHLEHFPDDCPLTVVMKYPS